jgi:hypothetical protein
VNGRPVDGSLKRPTPKTFSGRDLLTKAETVTVAAIETGAPTLVEAR